MTSDELKQSIQALPLLNDNTTWGRHRQTLRDKILDEDPAEFLTWPTITATMFVGDAPYIHDEFMDLEWRYLHILERNETNMVHQAYHLQQWESRFQPIETLDVIVEVGGGYGAMCELSRRLGFKGLYVIVDFPEFGALQKFHLTKNVGIYNTLFVPSPTDIVGDLIIGLYSVSEIEAGRDEMLEQIETKHHLFAYQECWGGINNRRYFKQKFPQALHLRNHYFADHWYLVD